MKLSFKHFSVLVLGSLLLLGGPLFAAESFTSEQLAEHLHLIKGPSGNTMVAADSDGLIPLDYATGKADSQSFGNFNVVGELPEMAALLQQLMAAKQ